MSNFFDILLGLLFPLLSLLPHLVEPYPVILVVELVAVPLEQIFEHLLHGGVVGSLVESQISALAEVLGELNGVALAEDLNRSRQLLLLDPLILVPLVVGLKSLPRQRTSQKVHHHVSDALHVVSAS